MLTRVLLRKLKKEALKKRNLQLPSEITEVKLNSTLSGAEQRLQYFKDVENPYLLRFGTIQITLVYADDGPLLSDLLSDYFSRDGEQK